MICKVCKRYFRAKAGNKYLVTEKLTPAETITKRARTFECFDCPKCGCQNMVNIREDNYSIRSPEWRRKIERGENDAE